MVLIVCQYEQQRVVELERLNTFKLMLEKEQQFVETKRSDLGRGYNPSVAIELANAEKRVRELQQKYNQMANRLGLSTSESQPQVHSYLHFFFFFLKMIDECCYWFLLELGKVNSGKVRLHFYDDIIYLSDWCKFQSVLEWVRLTNIILLWSYSVTFIQ